MLSLFKIQIMIKPVELKINNLVFASAYIDSEEFEFNKDEHNPKEWTIETVTELSKDDEYYIGTSNDYVSERVKGIPITEDWLKRGGFKKQGKFRNKLVTAFALLELELLKDGDVKCYLSTNARRSNQEMIIFRKIKYVHQLQNLYYELNALPEELVFSEA